jgi:hypothetical protein
VAISNFDKHLLIEQIRYIETEHPLACGTDSGFNGSSVHDGFEDRLWQRAMCIVQQYDLSPLLGGAARLSRYFRTFALILVMLLGALGVGYAVTDSHTINIYWLLLVLLGFNLVSMLLWLTGISLNIEALTSGMLARLTSWLPAHLKSGYQVRTEQDKKVFARQSDRAWLSCNFSGAVGKWQFSKISHQLWLAYLFAGLLVLVLLLMVRQYDFVWGTTLLSDSVFVTLTEMLSVPLDALGFATPSVDQVQDTRVGSTEALTAEHRYHWAQFLLGSLLCFGILPRIVLWFWSSLMCRRTRSLFTLDYYLPYYINLRQRLMPLASHSEVVDADTTPAIAYKAPARTPVPHTLPAETLWVAVELGNDMNWPPQSIDAANDLGQVVDRESLKIILQRLQADQCRVLAVAVSSVRAPDRGVQRTIDSLLSCCEQRWLVLLQKPSDEPASKNILAAWYRLADACKVPADHVISLSLL